MVRGDVYELTYPKGRGHVQHGRRYAVIVQSNELPNLSTTVVCPTSQSAPPASFHPIVHIGDERTQVMCEMVGSIDSRQLQQQVAHLSLDDIRAVDAALQDVLDLG